jgi:hypothetical protein
MGGWRAGAAEHPRDDGTKRRIFAAVTTCCGAPPAWAARHCSRAGFDVQLAGGEARVSGEADTAHATIIIAWHLNHRAGLGVLRTRAVCARGCLERLHAARSAACVVFACLALPAARQPHARSPRRVRARLVRKVVALRRPASPASARGSRTHAPHPLLRNRECRGGRLPGPVHWWQDKLYRALPIPRGEPDRWRQGGGLVGGTSGHIPTERAHRATVFWPRSRRAAPGAQHPGAAGRAV